MRIMNLLYKIVLVLVLVIMCGSSICYAAPVHQEIPEGIEYDGPSGGGNISGEGLPDLGSGYKPTADFGSDGKAITIIGTILSVLRLLGIVATIIGIALIGFGSILGSASEKAVNQEKYVGIVIAALIVVGASTIAKFIINFAYNI